MSIEYFPPTEIIAKSPSVFADLESSFLKYQEDPKNFKCDGQFKIGKKSIKARVEGEAISNGIKPFEWSMKVKGVETTGTSYSVTIELEEQDVDAVEVLCNVVQNFLNDNDGFDDWTVKSPMKNEKLQIKLAVETGRFTTLFNGRRIETKKYFDTRMEEGTKVEVLGSFEPVFKFKEKRAEVNFISRKFVYQEVADEEPKKKSRPHKQD